MVQSWGRITSGEPALAQEIAHSRLIGFSSALVKAQAESKTYPLTVTLAGLCALATRAATHTSESEKGAATLVSFMLSLLSYSTGTFWKRGRNSLTENEIPRPTREAGR